MADALVRLSGAARLVHRAAPLHLLGYLANTVFGAVLPVLLAWLLKYLLDELAGPGPYQDLVWLAVALGAVGLVGALSPHLGEYLSTELDRRVSLSAQNELFTAVERFTGLSRFEEPTFHDRLRLAQRTTTSPIRIVDAVCGVGRGVLTVAGFLGSLAVISLPFTAIMLLAAVPMLVVELRLARRRAALQWRLGPTERWEQFYSDLLSNTYAAKEVRLFGLAGFLRGRMNAEQQTANRALRQLDKREFWLRAVLSALSALLSAGGLIWAITAAGRGQVTVGDVSMFVASIAGVQLALNGLVGAISNTSYELVMFGHYMTVLRAEPDLPPPARPRVLPPLEHGIELRNVWFRYSDGHPWVLRGVNLFIPSGGSMALVGHNGAGKSTLVKLLCRFYDPTRGAILWDGIDLREVPVDELRERMSAVFQDFMNYDFSASDNIAVGDLAAADDQERLETAAKWAGVHETLTDLPAGYGTLLTRMFLSESEKHETGTGVMLSGGQWQRLALARAFLRADRDLMILDEPSAGLDAEAEHDVHTRLRQLRTGATSLLISHRLGAVRDADLIAVLSDGVVAELGRHADLLDANGLYARLFTLQASGYQLQGET
ncbi:ABC transporter ATP-binding protein [Actinomadura rudentiformis]|uniref:ABC transporter ATP-binding protein n=1 Tax=Actinomadura rudentiformis TaxID=359158 RepID=A0A6H9YPF4_9ACTN|nr:ABC transporter ATP-binding protein [Actinomadura rudentiformis]